MFTIAQKIEKYVSYDNNINTTPAKFLKISHLSKLYEKKFSKFFYNIILTLQTFSKVYKIQDQIIINFNINILVYKS